MKQIHTFFSLSLLLVFVLCSFLLLMIQIKGYSSMIDRNKEVEESHTPKSYLFNKLKFYDKAEIQSIQNQEVLVLSNDVNKTVLYAYQNSLCECSVQDLNTFDFSIGNKLFSCDSLSFEKKNGQITIYYQIDGKSNSVSFNLRGEQYE